MQSMRQIIYIHGGETFNTYEEYVEYLKSYIIDFDSVTKKRWRDMLIEQLGDKYEMVVPSMPSPKNAKYAEWKIWFEKYIPIIRDGAVLIGHSLGGIFLAKYLAENTLPIKATALFLVAAPYDDQGSPYSLADFILPPALSGIHDSTQHICLAHSSDDPVVNFSDFEKYKKALSQAQVMEFSNRGHFIGEEFPELVHEISLLK